MLKEKITYTDYDGNERTEEHYFNLSKAEIIRMNATYDGGLIKTLEKIIASQDVKKTYEMFEEIVTAAYGEKSIDGRRFEKDPKITKAFMQSGAYDELIVSFIQDSGKAAAFMNAIIPEKI